MDPPSTIPSKVQSEIETRQETKVQVQGEHNEVALAAPSTIMSDADAQDAGKNSSTEEDQETIGKHSEDKKDAEEDQATGNAQNDRSWTPIGETGIITFDQTQIYDPKTNMPIPMPSNRKEKKKAVVNVFLWFSKSIFFVNSVIEMEKVFGWIPKDLWYDLFTENETELLLRAREKTLQDNVTARLVKVIDEWREMDGFPKVPETLEEVAAARTEEQSDRNTLWFMSLMEKQTPQADTWIKYIWECVQDIMGFKQILDPDLPFRKPVVGNIAILAEGYFSFFIVGEVEERLRREEFEASIDEQISGLFNDILQLLGPSPHSSLSGGRDSDDDSDEDFGVD